MPLAPGQSLDSLVAQVSNAGPGHTYSEVATHIRQFAQTEGGSGEAALAGTLQNGSDPLNVVDASAQTLLVLYILSARLNASNTQNLNPNHITNFCRVFDPSQARAASERVKYLAVGIYRYFDSRQAIKSAIVPLRDLVTRYPPAPGYLTNIHPIFAQACIASHHFTAALPVISIDITQIDKNLSDLHYNDNLQYHYLGAIAFTALKQFKQAQEFFEIVVTSPTQVPASIQLEAYKKLILLQLVQDGDTKSLPKYTHPAISRIFKTIHAYTSLVKGYPTNTKSLSTLVEKEGNAFIQDGNLGLVKQAIARAPRWIIKRLTRVYVSLSLSEIGKEIGQTDETRVKDLILSMIEEGEINATLSPTGTLTFLAKTEQFTPEAIQKLLSDAQSTNRMLGELDRETGRRPEFLVKALKEKEGGGSFYHGIDEDIWTGGGGGGDWGGREWDD